MLSSLNFYSKKIFEENQNNLNTIKSLLAKIIFHKFFGEDGNINSRNEVNLNLKEKFSLVGNIKNKTKNINNSNNITYVKNYDMKGNKIISKYIFFFSLH